MKKTVLILGAGASADFGYPTWWPLKKQLNELEIQSFLTEIGGLDEAEIDAHKNAFEEFSLLAQKCPEYTLDHIIYEMDRPKEKHLAPTGHYVINIVGHLLAKCEVQVSEGRWIAELQQHLVDYVAETFSPSTPEHELNLLKNLTIISLNYDRTFEHFIREGFYSKVVDHEGYQPQDLRQSINFSRANFLQILQPHGYMCALPAAHSNVKIGMLDNLATTGGEHSGIRTPGNVSPVAFGDNKILSNEAFLRMGRHMYVVNEQGYSDYSNTNAALRAAEEIYCLGLSSDGICQSSLDFAVGQKIYLSNVFEDIETISSAKSGPEYVSLGTNGARLDACDFPKVFNDLCLLNSANSELEQLVP